MILEASTEDAYSAGIQGSGDRFPFVSCNKPIVINYINPGPTIERQHWVVKNS